MAVEGTTQDRHHRHEGTAEYDAMLAIPAAQLSSLYQLTVQCITQSLSFGQLNLQIVKMPLEIFFQGLIILTHTTLLGLRSKQRQQMQNPKEAPSDGSQITRAKLTSGLDIRQGLYPCHEDLSGWANWGLEMRVRWIRIGESDSLRVHLTWAVIWLCRGRVWVGLQYSVRCLPGRSYSHTTAHLPRVLPYRAYSYTKFDH